AVGTELLRRTSRGVALTPAGSAFLDSARETLAGLDRGVAAARNAAQAVSGRLSVGLQAATGGSARTRLLGAFERAYPEVSLNLLAYDLAQPAAGLLDRSSDVALVRPPIAAPEAADGCSPAPWRDEWLAVPRPGGDVPVIGAVAQTIEEWREHIAAGRGISLCPASSELFSARPGLVFVPSRGVPPTALCVAWRADDMRPAVLSFVKLAASLAPGG
ncbi:MAG: LysR substrate-binding domain-containing protein, partial [Actinomycetota bacterium]|nr:LysR substrate-binding domain-containing protein [Actinomycetota bacterium]